MTLPYTLLLAVLGSSVVAVQAQLDENCTSGLFDTVKACFTTHGLQLSVNPGQQDATNLAREAQAIDPAVHCPNKEKYKAAVTCSFNSLRKCLVMVRMGGAIPTSANFQQGMDVMCEKHQDFDSRCLKSHYRDILTCGQDTVRSVVQTNSNQLNINDIICISADANYDCSKKHLQACTENTRDIYLEQLDKYQVPAACVNQPPGRPNRQSYINYGQGDSASIASASFVLVCAVASLGLYLLSL